MMDVRWRGAVWRMALLAAGFLTAGELAAQGVPAGEDAAAGEASPAGEAVIADTAAEGAVQGPQFKFNLAPAERAPGAQAEVLLTAMPAGGYTARLAAASLPEPSSLAPNAVTYVVWLYDPTSQKKERVATLATEAGAGEARFEITWPSFALVVTAEPSEAPEEWSGLAVLTGQPALPETATTPAAETTGAEEPPVEPDQPAPAGPSGEGAEDPGAGAVETRPGQPAAGGAGVEPGAEPAGQEPIADEMGEEAAAPDAAAEGEVPADGEVPAEAGDRLDAEVSADPGDTAAGGVAVEVGGGGEADASDDADTGAEAADTGAEGEAGAVLDEGAPADGDRAQAVGAESRAAAEVAEAEPAPEPEERGRTNRRRIRNETLDRMAAAARGEDGREESRAGEGDAPSAAGLGAAKVELVGAGPAPEAAGELRFEADGSALLSAWDLPEPAEVGPGLSAFVLWQVDSATSARRNLGALESAGAEWRLAPAGVEPGAAFEVTAEAESGPDAPSGPVVLATLRQED